MISASLPKPDDLSGEIPVTPSLERWRAMSLEARDAHVLEARVAELLARLGDGGR